ncbi:G patch domain-containing protein 4 [Vanessa cardui]|uniref:G patch domain-containing protein 4 n=1 Tax=Vanessa cardui TaxID=171605 RepID=UPI001F12973A|nr:G patch domain-containing protein 4 [Vanessa cardui]
MDFARKQLEKYGWTDGKGLGKKENGISEPLKPKLKRSVAGIGYDAAADFTEHWWSALYDKAASNYQVEEENGKTKRMKRLEDKEFVITNSTWRLKKKNNDNDAEEYSDFFVKKAVLGSGGSKTTKVNDSDSEEETGAKDVKLTDEELFAACQGRTAHKGARHGLRALGKLARIEQQEQLLLQETKYNTFLAKKFKNADDTQVIEDTSLNEEVDINKKKKKKRKCCKSHENECTSNVIVEESDKESNERVNHDTVENEDIVNTEEQIVKKKSKKSKKKVNEDIVEDSNVKKKKKKRKLSTNNSALNNDEPKMGQEIEETEKSLAKKKKKRYE